MDGNKSIDLSGLDKQELLNAYKVLGVLYDRTDRSGYQQACNNARIYIAQVITDLELQ